MSDIAPRKQEHDYTKDVDALIQELDADSSSSGSTKVEKLLGLEKQARNAADLASTSRLLVKIIEICYNSGDYEGLTTQLSGLSKRHGQLREATRRMVDRAMEMLDELDKQKKQDEHLKLIETLREVTEGKIYLEVPRARVTRILSSLKEASGDVTAASDLLQDLQVETFASMERREKLEFILEQMRLLRLKENWEMLQIVSKKVNTKWLDEKENEDLKFKFYGLMIQYSLHMDKYLEVTKYYRALYTTPSVKEESGNWQALLRNIIFFIVLSPYDNEQNDLLHRILKDDDERLQQMPDCLNLAKCFTTPELTRWPRIESLYGEGLRQTRVFGPKDTKGVEGDIEEQITAEQGDKRFAELHKRVVEHNIRIIAKYYTRITLKRMSELLDLENSVTESSLSKMVVEKQIRAKIDRPAGIVDFRDVDKGTYKVLNEWSQDVSKLMALVEATSHLIGKEHAVAQAAKQRAAALKA